MKIEETMFGSYMDPVTGENNVVKEYTLQNSLKTIVKIISYGASIRSLVVNKNNQAVDIVLGFDNIEDYIKNPYFGATVGRVANRISNGKFVINDKQHQLSLNDGENHLHGGFIGFSKVNWAGSVDNEHCRLTLKYFSKNGEEGYPGDLNVSVTYHLNDKNELDIIFEAISTEATPVSMTNHAFFNLAGHTKANEKLKGHSIKIFSEKFTPVNEKLIPTGSLQNVEGTKYDLRECKDLDELLEKFPEGYDVNYCISSDSSSDLSKVAWAFHENAGLLEVLSDQQGAQFYTSNFLPSLNEAPMVGKEKAQYYRHGAFCVEAQNYPNALNQANFPSALINAGEIYKKVIRYKMLPCTSDPVVLS